MSRYTRYLLVALVLAGFVGLPQLAMTQNGVTQVATISGSDFTWIFASVKIEDIVMCENGTDAWAVGIGPGPFDDAVLFKITGVNTTSPSVDQDSFIGFPDAFLGGEFPAGMGPRGYPGLEVDPSCSFAYLPNFFLDSVAKVDLSSGGIVWPENYTGANVDDFRTIPAPVDAQLNEDGTKLLVSSAGAAEVAVLDAETGDILDTVPTGGIGPGSLGLFDDFLLSLGGNPAPEGANGVTIMPLDTFGQTETAYDLRYTWIDADGNPIATNDAYMVFRISVSVQADGSLQLGIADHRDRINPSIEVVSPAGAAGVRFEARNQGTRGPVKNPVTWSVEWTRDGDALESAQLSAVGFDLSVNPSPRAMAVQTSQDLACIDLTSNARVSTIGGLGINPFMTVASPDSSRLYVSNQGSNSVSVVEGLGCGKSVSAEIAVGSAPRHMVLSPNDRLLFVSNSTDNTVSVIDTASLSVVETIQVVAGGEPAPLGVLSIDKDGQYLYAFWEGGPKGTPGEFQIRVFDVSSLYR